MKKVLLGVGIVTSLALAQIIEVGGFASPESALVTDKGVFVSNVGKELKPSAKDGDGFISLVDKNGFVRELHFIDGLDAPKGSVLIGNILYVADVDRLRGFDIRSKKEVFTLKFEGTEFLNDITAKGKNTLYVSATDVGAVYTVNLGNQSYKKLADLEGANGLDYDKGKLYAVTYPKGTLNSIDTKSGEVTLLKEFGEGVLDGVQKVGDAIYVSDWVKFEKAGVIRVYNLKTEKTSTLNLPTFLGAADFGIDTTTKRLYMPEMMGNILFIIDLAH